MTCVCTNELCEGASLELLGDSKAPQSPKLRAGMFGPSFSQYGTFTVALSGVPCDRAQTVGYSDIPLGVIEMLLVGMIPIP